jgi:hypothetical protein
MESLNAESAYDRCIDVLDREGELLRRIVLLQGLVRGAVVNRQWTDFEDHLAALGKVGEEFEPLDRERQRYFDALSGSLGETGRDAAEPAAVPGEGGFYGLVSRLPREKREELSARYRQVKLEVLKIKLETEALERYLNEGRATVAAFLDAVFPDRKGRLYSRRGKQVPADMRSILFNRHF